MESKQFRKHPKSNKQPEEDECLWYLSWQKHQHLPLFDGDEWPSGASGDPRVPAIGKPISQETHKDTVLSSCLHATNVWRGSWCVGLEEVQLIRWWKKEIAPSCEKLQRRSVSPDVNLSSVKLPFYLLQLLLQWRYSCLCTNVLQFTCTNNFFIGPMWVVEWIVTWQSKQ